MIEGSAMDVSVIIPFYKGNKYINNVLRMLKENAAEATGISIEAIVVNDSPEICIVVDNALVEGYELKVIIHEKNMGIQQSRITGINAAKGEYILMLDQDDEIEKNAIKSQYNAVKGKDAVVANGYSRDAAGEKTALFKSIRQMEYVNNFSFYFYYGNVIASPGLCMVKKCLLPELWLTNIMSENGADDWLLWIDFLNHGRKFVLNEAYLYTHINDGNNTSNDNNKMIKSSLEALHIAYNSRQFNIRLLKVYRRRLYMRRYYTSDRKFKKIIAYILNPDIAIQLIKYKFA